MQSDDLVAANWCTNFVEDFGRGSHLMASVPIAHYITFLIFFDSHTHKLRSMTCVHAGIPTPTVFECMHSCIQATSLPLPFPPLSFSHVVHEEGVVGSGGNYAHFEPVLGVPVQKLVVHVHLKGTEAIGFVWGCLGFFGFFFGGFFGFCLGMKIRGKG